MPVITAPYEYAEEDLFVDLSPILGRSIALKCEGFNFAGSIKLKPAITMVEAAEREGRLQPNSVIVESSSGNLGVALAVIAASKGYSFVCVTDVRCNPATKRMMEALGAQVLVVTEPDPVTGLLGARMNRVRGFLDSDRRYVSMDQYANENNWRAHFATTAPAIARALPDLDVVFVGAGTTGTLMGCARWFAQWAPHVRVVAVDSVGSVTFGGPAGTRMIPGIGTSVRPAIFDGSVVGEVVMVPESDTVAMCRRLASRGFLFGGSTGTVVSGAVHWLDEHDATDAHCAAIAPDLGERYLDTVYENDWVRTVLERRRVPAAVGFGHGVAAR